MSDDALADVAPWRDIWNSRIRRSAVLMFAALLFAIGFHLVTADRINWVDVAVQITMLEVMMVLAADPRGETTSAATLQWMRVTGIRVGVYGAVAAAAATAVLVQFTPPVAKPLLVSLFTVYALGGFALVVGGSLVYWGSPRVRQWNRTTKPHPRLMAGLAILLVVVSAYMTIARVQRTGVVEPLRVTGLALVIVGLLLAALNPPDWVRGTPALDNAGSETT